MRTLARTAAFAAAAMLVIQASAGIWHEDFESDGLENWESFTDPQGADDPTQAEWEVRKEDGNGILTGEIHGATLFSALRLRPPNVDTTLWTNYKVQARARMDSKIQDGELAVFGFKLYDRWDNVSNMSCLVRLEQGLSELRYYDPQDFGLFRLGRVFEDETWYDISAEVKTDAESGRDTVTFIVDDDDPIVVEWPGSIGSGGVGLAIGRGRFSFDDLMITGDTIPTGGKGPLSVSPAGKAAQTWANLKR